MPDETEDHMTRGESDMRGCIVTHGIEEAARQVAEAFAAPFNLEAHSRLQGMIRAAYEAGQLDGMSHYKEPVF